MATAAQWLQGARPRTLAAAVAPVAVGTGAAAGEGQADPVRALGALVVALALQVGVNYANDYSDGIRGVDADRRGPVRLVGAGLASAERVRAMALASFTVAAACGLWLSATTSWWLVLVGAAAITAAWYYTGGSRPYGYRGLGEVSVFVFFGLVATTGTTFVQAERVPWASVLGGVGCGALACAVLVANNVRDLEADGSSGKRTLAVRLGDRRSRWLYCAIAAIAYAVVVALGTLNVWALPAMLSAALLVRPTRLMLSGARDGDLVPALKDTAAALLGYGLLLGAGLSLQ